MKWKMAARTTKINRATAPRHDLEHYCRDLNGWPRSWMGLEKDLPPGEQLLTLFRPFLEHLAASNLSPKTIQKHVDNMWVLGGEFIRDLRFARYRGDIETDLAACIPAVANWKQSTLPRALPPDQVERVLNAVDRKTAMGRRDYTILLILARLSLRAGEIRALTLDVLDWQEGLITLRGQEGRFSQLPL